MNNSRLFHKNFNLLATGQLISMLGNSIQRFALSLYVLNVTGSAKIFSLLLSISILPQIFISPFGGAIADRFSKKKIQVFLDLLSAFTLFAFTIVSIHEDSMLIVIGILMCVLSMIQSVYEPAVRSSIPVIVSEQNLTAANSIISEISAVSNLLGPILAGFLYGAFGIKIIFIINVISFAFSAALECFLHIPYTHQELKKAALLAFADDMKESFSFM